MNRICIAVLMTVMVFASGCGPSEQERVEATEKLLSAWGDGGIQAPGADDIRVLIREGADVNAKGNNGVTPLQRAALGSTPEIATLLIEAGADVNVKNDYGKTALNLALTPEIIKLLKAAGAKGPTTQKEAVEATEKLLSACGGLRAPGVDRIRELILDGADVNAKNDKGWTSLHGMCRGRRISMSPEIFTLLIEAGADVNARDNDGYTPLMLACGKESAEIVTLLIEAGADVNVKNDYGKTALNLALTPEIIKLLKAAGAKE